MSDTIVDKPTNFGKDDIVIALMGITGAGKSTFISLLADDYVQVGHELTSCKGSSSASTFNKSSMSN